MGKLRDIVKGMKLDRYKIHDIEIVVDRIKVTSLEDIRKTSFRKYKNSHVSWR